MKKTMMLAAILLVAAGEARAQYACGVPNPFTPRLNKINEAILELDRASFPNGQPGADLEAAITSAATMWNTTCAPKAGEPGYGHPAAAPQPLLMPRTKGTTPTAVHPGQAVVPIYFKKGQSPRPVTCNVPNNPTNPSVPCSPQAETITTDTGVEVVIWEKSGLIENGQAIGNTMNAPLLKLFIHEFGHVLNLAHDTCPDHQIMHPDYGTAGGPSDPSAEHCNRFKQMFEPKVPTDEVSEIDDDGLCHLLSRFCPEQQTIWPKVRSWCTWIPEIFSGFFVPAGETTIRLQDYNCMADYITVYGIGPDSWPIQHLKSPGLAVNPVERLASGDIRVSGWAWGRTDDLEDLEFWVDGQEITVTGRQMGRPDPGPCQAGVDPLYCDPNSGFVAVLRASGLDPGMHSLQIIATDFNEYPLPTVYETQFTVAPASPNHAPVAVGDQFYASVGLAGPTPKDLWVLDNDFDQDGDPVRLTASPILSPPAKGIVEPIGDSGLRYTPFPNASGNDSFTYQIVDPFGATANATVTIHIMEVMVP